MANSDTQVAAQIVAKYVDDVAKLQREIGRVIVGNDELVDAVLLCLFCGGHLLMEGVPGTGKTLLVRTLAECVDVDFGRIQCTPDLMPADVIGTYLMTESKGQREFRFRKGPVFANVVLADEINRATPKTQSALLESMQEGQVTAGGKTYPLPVPFVVLATINPIEMEGTYPLPEAQLDRFLLKALVTNLGVEDMETVLDRTTAGVTTSVRPVLDAERIVDMQQLTRQVPLGPKPKRWIARLVDATRPTSPHASDIVKKYVRYGASVRAAQAITLGAKYRALRNGRGAVAIADARAIAHSALRHRLALNFEAEAEGIVPESIVDAALRSA